MPGMFPGMGMGGMPNFGNFGSQQPQSAPASNSNGKSQTNNINNKHKYTNINQRNQHTLTIN